MLIIVFVTLYPFWYVTIQALDDSQDAMLGGIWFWPRQFTWSNLAFVLQNPFLQHAYLMTILRTVSGSLLALFVTGLAAYSLTKKHLRFSGIMITFLMIPMFISGSLMSNYVVMAKLHMLLQILKLMILKAVWNTMLKLISGLG